ncbi:hypothetical protein QWT69_11275 [Sporosarcina oncorhynchi]|uniref:Spore coat protein W n=1 Tax=Sporosarcina oncorhynchi TaxID=3056444 RepID=A0ABZ0L2S8_9BACL|nr:hypothetical protein [Sporosarcina sp. T2O-4]WOV86492.1 hypothetical protein QWT69_11275 [Sporosarcina sp. T2O-4]
MDEKKTSEQVQNLSEQFVELFVANLLTKNHVDIQETKKRVTEEQRAQLKTTVEKLKAQVEEFLETNTVKKTTESDENVVGQAVNPLREAFIERKRKRENKKMS